MKYHYVQSIAKVLQYGLVKYEKLTRTLLLDACMYCKVSLSYMETAYDRVEPSYRF
jgi:hypothetical protein